MKSHRGSLILACLLLGGCANIPPLGNAIGAGPTVSGTVSGTGVTSQNTKVALYYGVPAGNYSGAQVLPLSGDRFTASLDNGQSVAYLFAFQDLQGDNRVDASDPTSLSTSCSGCTYYKLTNLNGEWTLTEITNNGSSPTSGGALDAANIAFNPTGAAAYRTKLALGGVH